MILDTRSFILGLTALFQLLILNTALAQAEEAAAAGNTQAIVDFDVTPVSRMGAVLTPNARTPPPPGPLTDEEKKQVIMSLSDSSDSLEASGTFVLSASYAVHPDRGVLTLVRPHTVHPETGIHMRGETPGSVGVKVKVEEGGRYLVDFQLRSASVGKYVAAVEGSSEEVEDPLGQLEHVLVVLNARKPGWSTIRLSRPETDFMLYAVELTRFNEKGE